MVLEPIDLDLLKLQELRVIYDMSRLILKAVDSASALKEIIRLARPVFIFDNVVLYQPREDKSLEPIYARSVGRGRSVEADMAWGEAIAKEVLEVEQILLRQENITSLDESRLESRLNSRFFLGLPLDIGGDTLGALVFIRFGGPNYLPEQVNLAQLIAEHIEHLLERQSLVNRVANLEAERKLDQLQQEFVATVSHDLRSPLGFIKGYTTTLLREDIDWDRDTRQEFLSIIDEEADRLSRLIDDLLDSSRLQAGTLPMEFQELDLSNILKEYAQRSQIGDYHVDIVLKLEHSNERVWTDSTRMIQVLDNLISNSAKYAPDSPVTISTWLDSEHLHLSFEDEGPGIPSDQLENIFKRFFRLPSYRDKAKGSGLGLFICKQIINAHNGEIYAESTLGKGSCFHILLPRNWVPSDDKESGEEIPV
jgi:two-component system sensor histidine kinase KdpD